MSKCRSWWGGSAIRLQWGAAVRVGAAAWVLAATQMATFAQAQPQPLMGPRPLPADTVQPTQPDLVTLTQVVLRHNPGLQAAALSEQQAAAGITSARALPNPRIEVGQGNASARQPGAAAGAVNHVNLTQPFENPWLRSSRVRSAQSQRALAFHGLQQMRLHLMAEVETLAYEYFWRRDTAQVYRQDWQLLEQVRERVRVKVESGEAARYELIKADAEVINARQRHQSAEVQAQQVLLSFNRLAAGHLLGLTGIQGGLDQPVDMNALIELQDMAERRNPEIAALRAQLERARHQLDAARAQRLPGMELRYSQTQDPQVRQDIWGVQVQIPLLDQRQGPIAEAVADMNRMQALLDGRSAELRQQLLLAWKALDIARTKVSALSTGAVRLAETALQVAQAAYRFGERGILDVLDAQRILQSVRIDLLQARFELQKARIEIETLSAQRLDLAPSPNPMSSP
jgi:cobalt-zinc-cadmium efflux system outer membrane protein